MKDLLKQEKGVSLISLAAAIIILGIITSILVYSAKDTKHVESLTDMYTDIDNLSDKISSYYAIYGKIPALEQEIVRSDLIGIVPDESTGNTGEAGVNDTGSFLVIDLSALENLTLNYGKGYKDNPIFDESGKLTSKDLYIINETSHNIFYLNGVKVENKTYYTNQDKDTVAIDLRYVDGIKIPNGFEFEGRNSETHSITIKEKGNDDVGGNSYTWTKVTGKLKEAPLGVTNKNGAEFTEEEKSKFLESANAYEGYYKGNGMSNSNRVIYLPLNENNETSWSPLYEADGIYKDENGDTAYIPAGFKVSKLPTMNKINKGLVIKDATVDENNNATVTNGNEYVWIKVPKEVLKVSEADGTVRDAVTATEVENALKEYTKDYREENYEDIWYDGCGLTENEYINLKNQTMQSIKEYGGFYISRYEVGTEEQRLGGSSTESVDSMPMPSIKKDNFVYNYLTVSQAQKLANKLSKNNYKTSVMFGIQWDLVCKFIEENGILNKTDIINYNQNIGNYNNEINKVGQYKISNIYDFAGNVSEWTLQGIQGKPASRGGSVNTINAMSSITQVDSELSLDKTIGFRIMLIK